MAKRWYVVHVYSGFEKKVKEAILEQVEKKNLQDYFGDVLIPTHEAVEVRRGKKVTAEKKFFPGYILIQMEINEETWHLVKNTNKVTGFLGGKEKPSPISQAEAERLIKQVEEGPKNSVSQVSFEIGEQLRVADGPFASFNGIVEEVDEEKQRLKVTVSIFGRSTPVDLDFSQVEKF